MLKYVLVLVLVPYVGEPKVEAIEVPSLDECLAVVTKALSKPPAHYHAKALAAGCRVEDNSVPAIAPPKSP